MVNVKDLAVQFPILRHIQNAEETVWINPHKVSFAESMKNCELSQEDMKDAEERLSRFAPLMMKFFPETCENQGH